MKLSTKEKQALKAQAHHLKPIVVLGNQGLTENVHLEIERGLFDHELIKIRISISDRDLKRKTFADICKHHKAELIQLVGFIGVMYRKSDKNNESDR